MTASYADRLQYAGLSALCAPEVPALCTPYDLRDAPDDYPVTFTHEGDLPTWVTVDTPAQLQDALTELASMRVGKNELTAADKEGIENTLAHEKQHVEGYESQGVDPEDVFFGIAFRRVAQRPVNPFAKDSDRRLETIAFTSARRLTTTKLGRAAILARPLIPSDSDVFEITEHLGYDGLHDVTRRIVQNNRGSGKPLLVPTSIKGPWFRVDEAGNVSPRYQLRAS
jgi:hypothetical protein